MAVNFSYFRGHTTKRSFRNLVVFVIAKAQLNRDPYQVLSELSAIVRSENMLIDDSLLVVSEGGKNWLYGDNSLVDLVSQIGVPRFTHTLAI